MLYCIHNPISPDICSWNVDLWKSVKNRLKNSLFTPKVKKKVGNVLSVRFSQCLLIFTRANFFIVSFLSLFSIASPEGFSFFYFTDWKTYTWISFHLKKIWLTHTLHILVTFKNVNPRKSVKINERIHMLPLNIKVSIYHPESSSFLSWCMLLNKLDVIP